MNFEANNRENIEFNNSIPESKFFLRIHSIDFLKGFSLCIIILIHMADAWIIQDSRYFYAALYIFLDTFGISLFIIMHSITVIFWWKKKMGINPDKSIRNEILSRAFFLFGLGILFNIFSLKDVPFPLNLWGWNVFMFIGFSYIICYYSIRLSRGARWIIGFLIFYITTPIREFLVNYRENNEIAAIIHFIVVSPNPEVTFLPYAALCFFSTIFGERILESMLLESKKAYLDTFRAFITFGIIFLSISILYGYGFVDDKILDPRDYPQIELIPILQNNPFTIIHIPGFLIRGTAPNLFFGMGIALLLLGIFFYFLDVEKFQNFFIKILCVYGNFSLTLYLIHYIGILIFYRQLTIAVFIILFTIYIIILGFLTFFWQKFFHGIGSLEWMLTKIAFKKV
jgi:hypothetical protein